MAVKLVQNIAGTLSKSNIVKVGLGDALNMYCETQNPTEHSTQLLMRSISGCKPFVEGLDGPCRGMYRVSRGLGNKPALYAVFGNVLYLITFSGEAYAIQRIETSGSFCRMVETGGYGSAHPHLVIVDGLNCYALDVTLSVPDQIADFRYIQLPVRVDDDTSNIKPTHVAYLYGYLVINDEGTDAFYTSIQYPFETTDSLGNVDYDIWRLGSTHNIGFITYSEWCPDNTTALCSNGSKLYTFGPRSWQAFSFNDDKNNPFSSPDNAAGNIGIKAPASLAMLGHTALWFGASDIGENGVYMVNDTQLTRVSTGDLERELSQMKNPEEAYATIWQEHRHVFYALTFESSKVTYVYDVTENAWHRRQSFDNQNNLTFWRYGMFSVFAYNKTMVASGTDLCYLDENVYDEHDGKPILKMRRGGVLTNNDQPFYIDSLELVCNNGQHSFDDHYGNLELNPRVSFRYSWDGATFSDYEDYYLGKIGEYEWTTVAYSLGLGKFFTLEVSTTEKIPFCIVGLKVQFEPCAMM